MRSEFGENSGQSADPSNESSQLERYAFDTLFPDHQTAIADLRRADTEFDEICRDYQLLCDEFLSMNSEPGSHSYQFACDIRDTLDGLRDEILQSLRRAGKM
ncbi:hypothetical protein [Ruegeria conchae]|uniref:hypothetical protein n=1 Tax=Ruegeria conchae TaxID=981384 RepID=UPI0002379A4B|nr:hypothetical protein [Ruegeria conchae]